MLPTSHEEQSGQKQFSELNIDQLHSLARMFRFKQRLQIGRITSKRLSRGIWIYVVCVSIFSPQLSIAQSNYEFAENNDLKPLLSDRKTVSTAKESKGNNNLETSEASAFTVGETVEILRKGDWRYGEILSVESSKNVTTYQVRYLDVGFAENNVSTSHLKKIEFFKLGTRVLVKYDETSREGVISGYHLGASYGDCYSKFQPSKVYEVV
ncbi:hypothetical protein [[Leptolyngbya] sp. PCC 7376]|uniref:hypothetical protein n=1 Tax=[Leptolyngbya] sp. PCC 7376 TaxID=111781 RepID=UPI0002FF0475|nr:hypothetical protein [[Leptolyngbya] sp. PCC 7376]